MRTIEEIKSSIARIEEEAHQCSVTLNELIDTGEAWTTQKVVALKLIAFTTSSYQGYQELVEAQDAEIERLRLQCEWQPIETAPRDGTVIELIAPMSEYPRIGKWVDFPSFVFRGVREPGISKWVDANLTFPEIKNPILWRAIPPLPQPQEGSPMDNTLTDEVYP